MSKVVYKYRQYQGDIADKVLPKITMSKHLDDAPLSRRRALAAKLLSNGEGISEVSRKAQLSLPTVSKYKDLVERGGADALAHLRIHGGASRLDDVSQSCSLARSSTHLDFTAIQGQPGR